MSSKTAARIRKSPCQVTFKWQNAPWLDALTPQLAVNILFNQFVTSTHNTSQPILAATPHFL
jgi:hypothetical protein